MKYEVDPVLLENFRQSIDFANFPRQFRKWWFTEAHDDEKELWLRERFLCLKYPVYLSGFAVAKKIGDAHLPDEYVPIMGWDFQSDPHDLLFDQFVKMRPGEGMVLSDLDTQKKKRMILWPRGIFKTSAVIVAMVQIILNYPNVRLCFLTGGDSLAKLQLARVKKVFERPTKRFRWLFPDFCLKDVRNKKIKDESDPRAWTTDLCKMGTAHQFTVPARTNDILAEPTMCISTAKKVKAGSHYDFIFIDDLVNDQNYRSVKALEKCYQDYLDICPLLDPVGFIIMTGTRYSFGDTYERIQDMAKEEDKTLGRSIWTFSIRDCWSHGCLNCDHTDVYHDYGVNLLQPPCIVSSCRCPGYQSNGSKGCLFPETRLLCGDSRGKPVGHTLEFLEGERVRLGPEFFANQYENRPIAEGAQVFTETLIGSQTLHFPNQLPPYSSAYTFVIGDLAYVGQKGRDYSVLFICVKFQGQLFIIDCFFGNWDSGAVAENTAAVIKKHKPADLYYEKFNGWEAYDKIITAHCSSEGIQKIPLQWLKGSQAENAKTTRIGSVKGFLSNRRLWFYGPMPGYDRLVNQLCKWPKLGRHDDFADCAGMVVAAPTGAELEIPPAINNPMNWLRRLTQQEPQDNSYGDNGCGTGICC